MYKRQLYISAANGAITFEPVIYDARQSSYAINQNAPSWDDAVAAYVAAAGDAYCSKVLPAATGMRNQDACPGNGNRNIVFHYLIPMIVSFPGYYSFKFRTDWGNGGGVT